MENNCKWLGSVFQITIRIHEKWSSSGLSKYQLKFFVRVIFNTMHILLSQKSRTAKQKILIKNDDAEEMLR